MKLDRNSVYLKKLFSEFSAIIPRESSKAIKPGKRYKTKKFKTPVKTKLIYKINRPNVNKLLKVRGYNPRSLWPWFYKLVPLKIRYSNYKLLELFMNYGLRNFFIQYHPYLKWQSPIKLAKKMHLIKFFLLQELNKKNYFLSHFVETMMHKNPYRYKDYHYLGQLFLVFRDVELLDLTQDIKSTNLKKFKFYKFSGFLVNFESLNLKDGYDFFSAILLSYLTTVRDLLMDGMSVFKIIEFNSNGIIDSNLYLQLLNFKLFTFINTLEFLGVNFLIVILSCISLFILKLQRYINFKKSKLTIKKYNPSTDYELVYPLFQFNPDISTYKDYSIISKHRAIIDLPIKTNFQRQRKIKLFKKLNYAKHSLFFKFKFAFYYNYLKSVSYSTFIITNIIGISSMKMVNIKRQTKNTLFSFFFENYFVLKSYVQEFDEDYFKILDNEFWGEKIVLVHSYNPCRLLNSDLSGSKLLTIRPYFLTLNNGVD
jgi:hypothetical protein